MDELVAAALILYPRYVHPLSRERVELEAIIEHLRFNGVDSLRIEGASFVLEYRFGSDRLCDDTCERPKMT